MIKKTFFTLFFISCSFILLQANELDSIINQGKIILGERQYTKYNELLELLKSKEKDFENAEPEQYGNFCAVIGKTYWYLSKWSDAEKYLLQALSIREKVLGKEHPDYSISLSDLGYLYWGGDIKDIAKAESYFLEVKTIKENLFGKEHPDYVNSLIDLGICNMQDLKDFEKAETYFLEAKSIKEKVLENEINDKTIWEKTLQYYANLAHRIFSYYLEKGDFAKAELHVLESNAIYEMIYGKDHQYMDGPLSSLGRLYRSMEDFSKEEQILIERKVIFENKMENNQSRYTNLINDFGHFYRKIGDYDNAEKYFLESIKIGEESFEKKDFSYLMSLSSLSGLYSQKGDYLNAETILLKVDSLYVNRNGKAGDLYSWVLGNLGSLYLRMNNYEKAETYLLETLSNLETSVNEERMKVSHLNSLGEFYFITNDYAKAEMYYSIAKTIIEDYYGKEHLSYASSLITMGNFFLNIGDYPKAETYFFEANSIYEQIFEKGHPYYNKILPDLGNFYFTTKNYSQAEVMKIENDQIKINHVENNFSFLSERQRELNWNNNKENFETTYSYTSVYPSNTMTAHSFDNTLFTKGLLLRTTNGIREAIYSSGDNNLIAQYDYLRSNRLSLTALKQQENPNIEMISILENRVDSLDKELTRASAAYREFNQETSIKWKNIRDLLQQNEAAIEFVHFRLLDDKANFTDTVLYCALLLKKDMETPAWIPLFKETDLQELSKRKNKISDLEYTQQLYSENGQSLYNLIWQPLEKELQDIHTIYYAPSGMLHQISFGAVPVSFNHKGTQSDVTKAHKEVSELLSDRYNLQLLSSTREIFRLKKETTTNLQDKTAAIYGGLLYDIEKEKMIAEAQIYSPDITRPLLISTFPLVAEIQKQMSNSEDLFPSSTGNVRGIGIRQSFLPGTEKEVELINKYFNDSQIPINLKMYSAGNEESFKQLSGTSPGIIHIATHGYFFADIENKSSNDLMTRLSGSDFGGKVFNNQLLRSGLLLSGSNRAWTGTDLIEGIEDGILTADEISQMNLIKTELVVLSACETGLGEAKTAEGVFGLQRAFKLAGVETLIMSLWKVPDNATADLMTTFYQLWLSGKTKQVAFSEAQQQVREKYKDVYFWAGFVMLD